MAAAGAVLAVIAAGALTWNGRTPPQTETAARSFAPPERRSVAVLPFNTIGGGDRYFADGITEAVTTELGRVGGLRVIASASTFRYRDTAAFRDVARGLGAELVISGSVQRTSTMVRIDVSLVDTRDEQPIGPVTITAHDGRSLAYGELVWKHRSELQPLGQARVRMAAVAAE